MIRSPADLGNRTRDLASYFDDNNITPAESLAIVGLYASTLLAAYPPEATEGFKRALDKATNLNSLQ